MGLLDLLSDRETWDRFYKYKTSLALPKSFADELRAFIDRGDYLPVAGRILRGEPFPLAAKKEISKLGSGKKRVVYVYPRAENTVLKLLAHLMLRRYDTVFAPNLYSFRPKRTAKDAVRGLLRTPGINDLYCYKADVHDYFNSIPVSRLVAMLEDVVRDDPALFTFLRSLLEEERVIAGGGIVAEEKGAMAGTPLSAFYANLYLNELDRAFDSLSVPYARYSDDIILFAPTEREVRDHAAFIRAVLAERGLQINPKKEAFGAPGEGWVFLGFSCRGGVVDIAPATICKLKKKMRRKTAALRRWQIRNGLDGKKAAAAFIRVFRRKLLETPGDNELSWKHWFFPVINTSKSLAEIDRYAEDCLRFLISGTRTKARFNVRYKDLKALGFESVVHAYYAFGDTKASGGQAISEESRADS